MCALKKIQNRSLQLPTNVYFESNHVEILDTKFVIKWAKGYARDPVRGNKQTIVVKLKTVRDLKLGLALKERKICYKG